MALAVSASRLREVSLPQAALSPIFGAFIAPVA